MGERGIACSVGGVVEVSAAVVVLHKVPFFKRAIPSKAKFHVTVGHQTVLGTCQFFGTPSDVVDGDFRFDREYLYQRSMLECNNDGEEGGDGAASSSAEAGGARKDVQYALLEFEAPIICALGSMLIGSRLDADTSILVH